MAQKKLLILAGCGVVLVGAVLVLARRGDNQAAAPAGSTAPGAVASHDSAPPAPAAPAGRDASAPGREQAGRLNAGASDAASQEDAEVEAGPESGTKNSAKPRPRGRKTAGREKASDVPTDEAEQPKKKPSSFLDG
jgi:hypothetical protein